MRKKILTVGVMAFVGGIVAKGIRSLPPKVTEVKDGKITYKPTKLSQERSVDTDIIAAYKFINSPLDKVSEYTTVHLMTNDVASKEIAVRVTDAQLERIDRFLK